MKQQNTKDIQVTSSIPNAKELYNMVMLQS